MCRHAGLLQRAVGCRRAGALPLAEAAIANLPRAHLIAIVSNLETLYGSFRVHLKQVFTPFLYLDFKAAAGSEGADADGTMPKELYEQVFRAYRERWQPGAGKRHKRRHSDPSCYRGSRQPPLPTFPTVLLPATDPGGVGKFSFWSSERPAHGVGHSEAAKLDEYDYMPGNIKEAIGERSDEDDAGKDTDEDSEDDEHDDNLYF